MQLVRPGMKECEIAAAVTEVALQNGGQLSVLGRQLRPDGLVKRFDRWFSAVL